MECDVAVLGGGPGGYPAAIRAAQLGASVVLIEQGRIGGTCITVGCIPTKAWVATAHALKEAHETFAKIGVNVSGAELDFVQTQSNKDGIVSGLVNGITGVVKANGITVVSGRGTFRDANTIAVEGQEDITFKSAVIATGSHALRPPVDGIDGPRCLDSTSLLEITEVPRRLLVLGGGVIGCEFASIMQHWGVEVTIVEMLDRLIPMEDADASKELARAFKKRGITMHLGSRATAVVEGKIRGHGHLPGRRRQGRRGQGRPGVGGHRSRPQRAQHRAGGRRGGVRSPKRRGRRPPHALQRAAHLRRR